MLTIKSTGIKKKKKIGIRLKKRTFSQYAKTLIFHVNGTIRKWLWIGNMGVFILTAWHNTVWFWCSIVICIFLPFSRQVAALARAFEKRDTFDQSGATLEKSGVCLFVLPPAFGTQIILMLQITKSDNSSPKWAKLAQ